MSASTRTTVLEHEIATPNLSTENEDLTMTKQISKEEILIEALPYIQRYEGKTFVVKYGGAAMTDPALSEGFARDVTLLQKIGINIVLVHGGGPGITDLENRLGVKSTFVNGLRYTDEQTLRSVLMS